MSELTIKIEDSPIKGKKQVIMSSDGVELLKLNVKVTSEQVHDELVRYFLNCVRQDQNLQFEVQEAKAKALLED